MVGLPVLLFLLLGFFIWLLSMHSLSYLTTLFFLMALPIAIRYRPGRIYQRYSFSSLTFCLPNLSGFFLLMFPPKARLSKDRWIWFLPLPFYNYYENRLDTATLIC